MPYRDLREFIAALEDAHELRTVREADWNLEIGTLAELNYEARGPALLFDEIKNSAKGYRILTNGVDTPRRALLSLEMPIDLDTDSMMREYRKKVFSQRKSVPPAELSTGPVFENAFFGKDVDLWKLPTPRWHERDGGRYLGTGSMVIMRDPDSGIVSFGCYRVMVHDEVTAGLYITPSQKGALIRRKYWEQGKSCPVAVSFGQEPALFVGAGPYIGHPTDMSKYELVGHIRGAPVEVIREEITGLPIPATAEIVIAGEVPSPEVEHRDEGPFGEWTGYYAHGTRPEPVIRVRALYHRNDPIILGMPPVRYRHATAQFGIPTRAALPKEKLQRAGVEDVLDVWPLAIPGVTVVQIRQRYPGHAIKAALAASGEYMGRFVVVVDEDINPRDVEEVLWAVGTRCDPETSITILGNCPSSALDPRIPPERKDRGDFASSRPIINACKPYDWISEFPPINKASEELRTKISQKWKDLFSKEKPHE